MIRGVVATVPKNTVINDDAKFVALTGVSQRRIAVEGQDTMTLAFDAASHLLTAMRWQARDIGAIIFVTQTPVVRMPANACKLAHMIGSHAPAFDVNLACSGYVYGLWIAQFLGHKKTLLIAGDTVSRMCDPLDKATAGLFGDCVTATAVEHDDSARWSLGTDGSGFDSLIADPLIRMEGGEVFNFCNRVVPKMVDEMGAADWYLFHQANEFILNHLVKKCEIATENAPQNLQRYGNTSSASIPLLMCDSACTESLKTARNTVALFGFGAGFSHAACALQLEPLKVAEVIER